MINMERESSQRGCSMVVLLLCHAAAAVVCFAFLTVVPVGLCLVVILIANDPGGPLFLPVFIVGVVLFAAATATALTGAALATDLVRWRWPLPVWVSPLVVFILATVLCRLLFPDAHPATAPIVGGTVALAFIVHCTAIALVRALPDFLVRRLRTRMEAPHA
jgi:hypothetical protein